MNYDELELKNILILWKHHKSMIINIDTVKSVSFNYKKEFNFKNDEN